MSEASRRTLLVLGICLAWALTSIAPLLKYLPPSKAIAALALGLLSITIGMFCLIRLNLRPRQIGISWFLLLFLALTTAFAILYPLSLRHTLNIGSDREDALRIELLAVRHHQYPYDARTFLGNPPTPLPGAMLIAAPFFALGHIAWQNFFWLASFFFFAICFFQYRATALFYLMVFLLFAPAHLSDFTSGGDYLTNFFYIAIAVALFNRSLAYSLYASIPAALFLGVALSSRILYAVILIPLLSLALQRTSRLRAAVLFFLVSSQPAQSLCRFSRRILFRDSCCSSSRTQRSSATFPTSPILSGPFHCSQSRSRVPLFSSAWIFPASYSSSAPQPLSCLRLS